MKHEGPRPGAPGPVPLDAGQFSLADQVRRVAKVVRTIIGVPDYDRYVAHVKECHPDRAPMTRDEFAKSRMEARYNQPGNRCC
jgi:uncharacterized short protein YbdD (DUF466 family)